MEGQFWLASRPANKVGGRLSLGGENGIKLALLGSFHDDEVDVGSAERFIIQGIAGHSALTLDSCFLLSSVMNWPGIDQETYHVPVVLEGAHYDEGEVPTFNKLYLRLQHLRGWVGRSGIKRENPHPDRGRTLTVTCTEPSPLLIQTDFGELSLSFPYSASFQRFEFKIEESCRLALSFNNPQSLERIVELCSRLQDLVTIGVDAPATIVSVSVADPSLTTESPSGEVDHQPIKLHTHYRGSHSPESKEVLHPPKMMFTFEDIRGLQGIVKWLETSDKFKPVIDSLLSHWYIPRMYTENRFFNAIVAAETLETIRLGKQNISFHKALTSLTSEAGSTFAALVGNVDIWIKRVVRARHNNVVHRGLRERESPNLWLLSESVYFLVVLCLLRRCGVPEGAFSRLQRNPRFRWLTERHSRTPP